MTDETLRQKFVAVKIPFAVTVGVDTAGLGENITADDRGVPGTSLS